MLDTNWEKMANILWSHIVKRIILYKHSDLNPKWVTIDFEVALHKAMQASFPNT